MTDQQLDQLHQALHDARRAVAYSIAELHLAAIAEEARNGRTAASALNTARYSAESVLEQLTRLGYELESQQAQAGTSQDPA